MGECRWGPEADNDKEFATATKVFAAAYDGRPEELVAKIEELARELAKPSTARAIGTTFKNSMQWLIELVVKSGIEAGVKTAMKSP
jgi:hypothetical protein